MKFTKDLLERALKLHSYQPALRSPKNQVLHLPQYMGNWIQSSFPDFITSAHTTSAIEGAPYLTWSINTESSQAFYGLDDSAQRLLIHARSETAWMSLRFRRPSKIPAFLRKTNPLNYLQAFSTVSASIPLFTFIHLHEMKEVKDAIALARKLLEYYRRPCFFMCPPDIGAVIEKSAYSLIKVKAVFQNAVLDVNNDIYDTIKLDSVDTTSAITMGKKLSTSEISLCKYSDYHMYITGIGPSMTTVNLPTLNTSTYSQWTDAATVVKSILNSTLGSSGFALHTGIYKSKLEAKEPCVPNLDHYPVPPKFNLSNVLNLNRKLKVACESGLTQALLELDNTTLQAYNATQGRHTGIIDCLLSRPNLLSQGPNKVKPALEALGYKLKVSKELEKHLTNKQRFYARQSVPLNPVSNTELLAYFEPGSYTCKKTTINPTNGNVIWEKDKKYDITPGWSRETYDAGDEPIVDEFGKVIGSDTYQLKISVLQLKVATNDKVVLIKENECRESIAEEGAAAKDWYPVLDEFIDSFDLPVVPHVATTHATELEYLKKKLIARLPHLKPYQVNEVTKNVLKKGGILASTMGSGKTHMGMATLFLRDKAFNLIVVPPALVSNWLKTLTEFKFHAQTLLSHESVDDLITHFKSLRGLKERDKRAKMHAPQEFYITTPEFLALGDWGNKIYDSWTATYRKKEKSVMDPTHGKVSPVEIITVTSTRYHAELEAKEMGISLNQTHEYGNHITACPKCEASRFEGFTYRGFCKACNYIAYTYIGTRKHALTYTDGSQSPANDWIFGKYDLPVKSHECFRSSPAGVTKTAKVTRFLLPAGSKHETECVEKTEREDQLKVEDKNHSSQAYPAYKRLGKIFGAKLIDEVHEVANFDSQKGSAVKSIKADETWACSGTISRGHVKDIESAILHSYEANSPLCPYSEWDKTAFREQFITQKVKKSTFLDPSKTTKGALVTKTKSSVSIMPEASNVTLLRKILATKMTMVPPAIVEAEWKLPPATRKYVPVKLSPANEQYYYEVLANIASWYKHASSKDIRHNTMSKLWELRHICEGEDKLNLIRQYIIKWRDSKEKFVIVSPTKPMYLKIKEMCKELKVNIITVDEAVPTSKREEVTSKFEDPAIQGLVARTKLVNTGLNTLVYANKLLIAGLEYFPSSLRQMEKRLIRPGQKAKQVEIIYPIIRLTPKESVEEQMLRLIFRKESAVDEVLQGKIRWIKSAQLIESLMEKQGAGKVLESLMDNAKSPLSEVDLNALFEKEYNDLPETKELLERIKHVNTDEIFGEDKVASVEATVSPVPTINPSSLIEPITPTTAIPTSLTPSTVVSKSSPSTVHISPSTHTPGMIINTTDGPFLVTPAGRYVKYDPIAKKGKRGKPYMTLPATEI